MRKQVDFDARVFDLGNGANGSWTHEKVAEFLRENYFSSNTGWEVLNSNAIQVSAGVISLMVILCRYEDVTA